MTQPGNIVRLILSLVLTGCMTDPDAAFLQGVDYDHQQRILTVSYSQHPDTSLHQIIALSHIRRSGYGLLINIDNAVSPHYLEEVREGFKKLDINAVHVFHSNAEGLIDHKTRTAIEGARFIWVFAADPDWRGELQGSALSSAVENSLQEEGILVLTP